MRTARASIVTAILLAIQPVCVFGDGTVFPPDPVGEKMYRAHLLADILPIAIIVCALVAAWAAHKVLRKAEKPELSE
jgi:hypothetical protein